MRNFLKSNEKGAVIVLFALLTPIMMICAGLAIDLGNLYAHKSRLQNAADAAALAGARAYAIHSDTETTDYHPKADEEAEKYAKIDATENNLRNAIVGKYSAAPDADEFTIYYKVDLTETVPLYFLRIVGLFEQEVKVSALATIVNGGYEYKPSRDVFIFKHKFNAPNSVQNPDENAPGSASTTFDGNVAFTDGSGNNKRNANNYRYESLTYGQNDNNPNLRHFFTSKMKEDNLSIKEALARPDKNYYAFEEIFEDYDMSLLARQTREKFGIPPYSDVGNYPNWNDYNNNWEAFSQAEQISHTQREVYLQKFMQTTDGYKNLNTSDSTKFSGDYLAITANNGDGNVDNFTVDGLAGDESRPFYLYLDESISIININVTNHNDRPIIVLYNGTGQVNVNISSGTTFSGVVYAPNTDSVLMRASDANFEGTVIAGSVELHGDNANYRYKQFVEGQTSDGKGSDTGNGKNSKGASVRLVDTKVWEKLK